MKEKTDVYGSSSFSGNVREKGQWGERESERAFRMMM